MNSQADNHHNAAAFFTRNYYCLRSRKPMEWMKRLFNDVCEGRQPRLIDLPTGAGKTELVVIWLLALAYYGAHGRTGRAVPRRLVWVINRRVLVRQVFDLAKRINEKLADVPEVQQGLAAVSGDAKAVFRVVQLRGQILADTRWATLPAIPQLIIGTVDQIGSRLLFQGYGLGKWNRPQQATLLGVDAWIAVDESHLVPAFILSLRQINNLHTKPTEKLAPTLDSIFERLPFWLTELSATPSLPAPEESTVFRLKEDEKQDAAIADRILAANTRRVQIAWIDKAAKPADALADALATEALRLAKLTPNQAIAIFVQKVKDADKVVARLRKGPHTAEERVCKITGRLRGYERDQLAARPAFRRFLPHYEEDSPPLTVFLVGTAAAEVGLDADADVIVCDFAPLPTLLQRLGRLDRRGEASRRCQADSGDPPTMTIFAFKPKVSKNAKKTRVAIEATVDRLAKRLKKHKGEFSAELLAGTAWRKATPETDKKEESPGDSSAGEDEADARVAGSDSTEISDESGAPVNESNADADEEADTTNNGKGQKFVANLIEAATWKVLGLSGESEQGATATPPAKWLEQEEATVAAGPVVVPALTRVTLEHWTATTEARTKFLSPHPFLYGQTPDAEGTPLVSVAFRLELQALREDMSRQETEDDTELEDSAQQLIDIFKHFPPLRAEFHHVPLADVRKWLLSETANSLPILFRHRDRWRVKPAGESGATVARNLSPASILLLPAAEDLKKNCKPLLEEAGNDKTTHCDVFGGVSAAARYQRRVTQTSAGDLSVQTVDDGAFHWLAAENEPKTKIRTGASAADATANAEWVQRLRIDLTIGGGTYRFDYLKPKKESGSLQYLRDHEGHRGHLERAEEDAAALARRIDPASRFLETLLRCAAQHHDEGKRELLWQRAMGNRSGGEPMLAKPVPKQKPGSLHGYRHEWQSLRQLVENEQRSPEERSDDDPALWQDLLMHIIGTHHGRLRPSLPDNGLNPRYAVGVQNPLRLAAAERYVRLQRQIGCWRLAYIEALLKTADVSASQALSEEESDED